MMSCRSVNTMPSTGGLALLLVFGGALAVGVTSCGKRRPPAASAADSEAARSSRILAQGKNLYLRYCGPCHGKTGEGDGRYLATGLEPRPSNLTRAGSDALDDAFDTEELELWIRQGSAAHERSNLCPPWGLTLADRDIHCLAQFVRSLRKGIDSTAQAPP